MEQFLKLIGKEKNILKAKSSPNPKSQYIAMIALQKVEAQFDDFTMGQEIWFSYSMFKVVSSL